MMTLVDYVPITGVQAANKVEGWFFDMEEIDPEYEMEVKAIEEDTELTDEERENTMEDLATYWDASYLIYGDWKKDPVDGKYGVVEDGPTGFAAKFNRDENTIQVLWSKWAVYCQLCSPCYPGQGDIDSPGITVVAYCLPPEFVPENDSRVLLAEDIMAYEQGDTSKEDVKRVKFFSQEG